MAKGQQSIPDPVHVPTARSLLARDVFALYGARYWWRE